MGAVLQLSGHSGNSSLLPVSGGMMQNVCVHMLLIECVFVCYRWTPRDRAWWLWTAYRDRSLSPTVRCTSPCCPSSSRNFQVIKCKPKAEEDGVIVFKWCNWRPSSSLLNRCFLHGIFLMLSRIFVWFAGEICPSRGLLCSSHLPSFTPPFTFHENISSCTCTIISYDTL